MAKKLNLSKKLYRSETERVLAGVAGGLGEYLEIDPTIIRIIFVLLTVFGGSGILIYVILWILIPNENDLSEKSEETIRRNTTEMKQKAQGFAADLKDMSHDHSSRNWLGILIVILGILLVFDNLGFLRFHLFWPLLIILFGLFILLKDNGKR